MDPLAHVIHKPTFELELNSFLFAPPNVALIPSFKALLLAMYLAAAVSLSPMECQQRFYMNKQMLVAKLRFATEKALADANYIKSIKLQTLQAFTIYMVSSINRPEPRAYNVQIPQCRTGVSRSSSIIIGLLVRLAKCAGLQCDTGGSSISPEESQVRRLLWHQICFLDLHKAERQGSLPQIRDDDYNTLLPFNVDDITCGYNMPSQNSVWTDTTLSLIRYECNMVHRPIFRDQIARDYKARDLKTVQLLVDRRKDEIEENYLSHLDEKVPVQRCAKLVGKLLTTRFDEMSLQGHLTDGEDANFQREIRDS